MLIEDSETARLHGQRSGVASQQRLRPRHFDSTVKGEPINLRFEHVSFLFLVCLEILGRTDSFATIPTIALDEIHSKNFF